MQATAKDLRIRSRELLETAARGHEVVITYRGNPCAKLVPLGLTEQATEKPALFGIWKDHQQIEDVPAYVRSMRKARMV